MDESMMNFTDSPQSDDLAEFLRSFDFAINTFGVWQQKPQTPVVKGYICNYQLAYVVSGTLRVVCADQSYVCPAGSIILFEPFEVYSTQIISDTSDFRCYTIQFDVSPEHRKKEFMLALMGAGGNVYLPDELPIMSGMFSDLYQSQQGKELGLALQTGIHLRLICLYLLRARWPKGFLALSPARANSTREAEVVQAGMRYIRMNISRPLRVGDISAALNISESYLYKCFVSVFQMPPSQYILRYKIGLSVEMMTSTARSMEEISDALGFSSLYHFSKTFKQIMGCSPRQYLTKMQES